MGVRGGQDDDDDGYNFKLKESKKDELMDTEAWRPINLIEVLAKVFEGALLLEMAPYMQFSPFQFAYQLGK